MTAIDTSERRARLARRHLLSRPARSVDEAAAALVGLHSSDPTTVYLSARSRVDGFAPTDLEDALYERRSLVRMLGMRRTIFVVPRDVVGVIDEACTRALGPPQRRRLVRMLEEQGVVPAGRGRRWVERVCADVLEALGRRGEATARELTKDVPELGAKLTFGQGKSWGGTMGVSTRVLFLLAAEGAIVRTRPLGTWVSGQYRWARTETWLGEPLPALDHAEARAEVVRRYLGAFGPATLTDVRWWTGWTLAATLAALRAVGAAEVALEDGSGFALPDDVDPLGELEPWVALLPSLDPTVMGWKERAWYLGDHAEQLFDRNGNAGPTVWAHGRIVGGWTQTDDGEIRLALLEPVDAKTRRAIDRERERLRGWFGDVRIKGRFRSPIEASLSSD